MAAGLSGLVIVGVGDVVTVAIRGLLVLSAHATP